MKAWQMVHKHHPLVLQEVPEPVANAGEVVVSVRAAGLCHSDLGFLEEDGYPLPASLPLTLGHEVSGVICELGAGVSGWQLGDRVGIANIDGLVPGIFRDGGFTSKITAQVAELVRMPQELSFEQACIAADAGATAHHAVIAVAEVRAGMRVGIIGYGGLGQVGARIAVLAGATVYVAEPKIETWSHAHAAGVAHVARDIREFTDAQLDVIIDFAGFGDTTAAAVESVRRGGRVVQAGMAQKEATINIWTLIMHGVTITPTLGGTAADLAAVYELLASGQLSPRITTIEFTDIPQGLAQLSAGQADGRLVALVSDARCAAEER